MSRSIINKHIGYWHRILIFGCSPIQISEINAHPQLAGSLLLHRDNVRNPLGIPARSNEISFKQSTDLFLDPVICFRIKLSGRLFIRSKNLKADCKAKLIELLKEYVCCFAWEYHEMPGLSRELVEG